MDTIVIVLILAAAAIGGSALMFFARNKTQAKHGAIEEMCRANGWRFEKDSGSSTKASSITISDPAKSWVLEETFASNAASSQSSTVRRTTWTDPDAGIAQGHAVLSLAMPADKAAGMEKFLGMMGDGKMEKTMIAKFFGTIGTETPDLVAVNVPGAAGLMMATPDAQDALTAVATHPALADTQLALPKGAMPTIIRSADGLQLHLRATMNSPEQVAAMVQLGETLSAALSDG